MKSNWSKRKKWRRKSTDAAWTALDVEQMLIAIAAWCEERMLGVMEVRGEFTGGQTFRVVVETTTHENDDEERKDNVLQ